MIKLPYLREIPDHEWVREVISEKFQNATDLMTPNSVVYGGAVRDAIAGLELEGDLDIAVPVEEISTLRSNFMEDTRWRPRKQSASPFQRVKAAGYAPGIRESIPMQDIVEFYTFNEAIVQMVVSNMPGENILDTALAVARQVDILCCGMVLTHDGRIFETLEGAFENCKDRILRINDESTTIHLETVPSRIDKLVKRGWTSMIDVKETFAKVEAMRKKQERDKLRQHASQARKKKKMFESFGTSTGRVGLMKARSSGKTKDHEALDESLSVRKTSKKSSRGHNLFISVPAAYWLRLSKEEIETIVTKSVPAQRRANVHLETYSPPNDWIIWGASYSLLLPIKHNLVTTLHNKGISPLKQFAYKPKTLENMEDTSGPEPHYESKYYKKLKVDPNF